MTRRDAILTRFWRSELAAALIYGLFGVAFGVVIGLGLR